MLDDTSEVVTLIAGEDADPAITESLLGHLAASYPEASVDVIDGGQPLYPYLIGVE